MSRASSLLRPARRSDPVAVPHLVGPALARDALLLAADCAIKLAGDEIGDAHTGWPGALERWEALRVRQELLAAASPSALTDDRLVGGLELDPLSYWLVMACAATELFPEAAAAASILAEDERIHLVTPATFARLMRAWLEVPYLSGLAVASPGALADRMGLIERLETHSGRALSHQPLRLTRRELQGLLAELESPEAVDGQEPASPPPSLPLLHELPAPHTGYPPALVEGAASLLEQHRLLCIRSPAARQGRQLALDLASLRHETALLLTVGEDLPDPIDVGRLRGGLVVVDLFSSHGTRPFPMAYVQQLRRSLPRVVVVVGGNAATLDLPTITAPPLGMAERRRIWSCVVQASDTVERLARRFRVSLDEVRSAVRAARFARRLSTRDDGPPSADEIHAELLVQGERRMGRLVTPLRSSARLEQLVVSRGLRQTLQDIAEGYQATTRVFDDWGMSGPSSLGRGLTCLFSGPPGTGKTLAAQCLANALGLNLYRIDLSQVVSKYIGETEKALAQIFDEAEAGHGILLFDEADTLFGRRSEVKDAHDRYANIEVGYLLQRLEQFDGMTLLTTNLSDNIDTAFLRRFRFVVEFPMPSTVMRRTLWEQSLPPRERWARDIDLDPFVERFPLAGGDIYNIGLAAAHLAAASQDGLLRTEHLVRATYRELEKVGLGRARGDFGPLAVHLPGRD